MNYDLPTVLECCGAGCAVLWLIGFPMLLIAVKKSRHLFRSKGYLRTPSGLEWFPFLLKKRYESFDEPAGQTFFGISYFCAVCGLILLCAAIVLLGCVLLFGTVSQVP